MKLKKIAVSGFKSFVDPTNVRFNAQIIAVVGPNGCGKSNVIDAVRWVMGESSAKMLRGDSMEDVIFNGSSSRKPVGRASVELFFDNSLGRIKSHYQQFSEIVIKRVLSRDGKSDYRINDKKVRRKDVLDLFRGTGLGPRSYSIIEQGMVSRIVEAKPEELRAYVEEAAGISRYKDRRRETENRIRHTRENVERSEDIRSELLAQLRRLKRQAQAAERYKKLQQKRRDKLAILYRLRFDAFGTEINDEQKALGQATNTVEKRRADQREIEAAIERKRSELGKSQDGLSEVQADFYKVGAEISKIEQKIEHIKVTQAQDANALDEVNEALAQLDNQMEADNSVHKAHRGELDKLMPGIQADETNLAMTQAAFEQAREAFNNWQSSYTLHRQNLLAEASRKQLQLSIIDQINRQQHRAQDRQGQLETEQTRLKEALQSAQIKPLEGQLEGEQAKFDELKMQVEQAQRALQEASESVISIKNKINEAQAVLSTTDARVQSLQEFQAAALSTRQVDYAKWLAEHHLTPLDKVAGHVKIASGWERAADRILAPYLNALLDPSGQHPFWLQAAEHEVTMVSIDRQSPPGREFPLPLLSEHIEAQGVDIAALVAGVYVAEDAATAQQHRLELHNGERIVTKAGILYGANSVSHAGSAAQNTGYLVREEEMQSLIAKSSEIQQKMKAYEQDLKRFQQSELTARERIETLLESQDSTRQQITDSQREIVQLNTAQEYTSSRLNMIVQELSEIQSHDLEEKTRLNAATLTLQEVEQGISVMEDDTTGLADQEQQLDEVVQQSSLAYRDAQNKLQTAKLEQTRLETASSSLENSLERMAEQLKQHKHRKQALFAKSEQNETPTPDLSELLETQLASHKAIEAKLLSVRDEIAALDNTLREQQTELSKCIEAVNHALAAQEQTKMALQDRQIRQQSLAEEAARDSCAIESVELPEAGISIESCEHEVSELERKVASIGAVNLVAIEEYESQSERADYLEKQHKDLLDALDTLEKVIRKIDKETRIRFEETYTALNKSFTAYFPKLFGGGRASLSLTSEDWLTTGVTVMAQPPGKRNSTIHLLSGGEKALTAVSLLFALFELNPAPFCMMDEVDAPLDDANVDRFCDTLKSLSEHAQIIVITHNKITMQAAHNLIGVTMNEPGVSRVVSVDVDQAMELVEE